MSRNRKSVDLSLGSSADIFSTQAERDTTEGIREIALSQIDGFTSHPFHVKDDDEMLNLVESVKAVGILVPVQVRPKGGRFELVSGHRRKRAAELAGLSSLPAVVRELSDDEAVIAMVDSNLQRERILPSEKAFAYKMKLEAIKHQGKRTDLTFVPLEQKSQPVNTIRAIGKEAGESQSQVQRYIRLTYLINELLAMVDEGKIALRPAVEISYLTQAEQRMLLSAMEIVQCSPSHAQAIKLRRYSKGEKLTEAVVQSIMEEQKPNQVEQFRMPKAKLSRYFRDGESAEAMERRIIQALDLLERLEREQQSRHLKTPALTGLG